MIKDQTQLSGPQLRTSRSTKKMTMMIRIDFLDCILDHIYDNDDQNRLSRLHLRSSKSIMTVRLSGAAADT